jgi:TonB family protein
MPNPSYTDEARKAKFSGTILLEGIIYADGTLEPVRVVKGAPFGLNGAAFSSMTTWKCRAAIYGGKSVPALVSFEVNFRLY